MVNKKFSSKGFFIVGTDTKVGKTTVAIDLLKYLKERSFKTAALKPIASGCRQTLRGLRNQDALKLQKFSTLKIRYKDVNPFAFKEAIAPHLAASKLKMDLTVKKIVKACRPILKLQKDYVIIEGAGGVLVPVNEQETMLDLAKKLQFPLILVVGLRLGCLNHALLTLQAIQKEQIKIAGWVGFPLKPRMQYLKENVNSLIKILNVPYLGLYPNCLWSAL